MIQLGIILAPIQQPPSLHWDQGLPDTARTARLGLRTHFCCGGSGLTWKDLSGIHMAKGSYMTPWLLVAYDRGRGCVGQLNASMGPRACYVVITP